LLALESEILRRMGSPKEALPPARKALEITLEERSEAVHYRAFTPLVAARLATALEVSGRVGEAREIRERHVPPEDLLVTKAVRSR
ncbi:MAG: hypothetical protein R3234_07500, partial [Thermoanaerobaculia bacterium]|nr:hypothetical protein [Thermoanaerobaculia bacterium]